MGNDVYIRIDQLIKFGAVGLSFATFGINVFQMYLTTNIYDLQYVTCAVYNT